MYFPDYLLTENEPGHRARSPNDIDEADERCPTCLSPHIPTEVCPACGSPCSVEYSPVRASFLIETATGRVVENGWA